MWYGLRHVAGLSCFACKHDPHKRLSCASNYSEQPYTNVTLCVTCLKRLICVCDELFKETSELDFVVSELTALFPPEIADGSSARWRFFTPLTMNVVGNLLAVPINSKLDPSFKQWLMIQTMNALRRHSNDEVGGDAR